MEGCIKYLLYRFGECRVVRVCSGGYNEGVMRIYVIPRHTCNNISFLLLSSVGMRGIYNNSNLDCDNISLIQLNDRIRNEKIKNATLQSNIVN